MHHPLAGVSLRNFVFIFPITLVDNLELSLSVFSLSSHHNDLKLARSSNDLSVTVVVLHVVKRYNLKGVVLLTCVYPLVPCGCISINKESRLLVRKETHSVSQESWLVFNLLVNFEDNGVIIFKVSGSCVCVNFLLAFFYCESKHESLS